ncbi:hypothetical protein GCM10010136_18190 [Limoniibacter endophyticus]|uniref:Uncharacterized protein n=1 Tax=Limoniibacter endophyticus TaxID=1565040 RepID=A0A8J3DHG4_9HYPH|nr:hypothetical protein GCM10010136_18190 [Limoniibacter endophyticus]
MPNNKEGSSIQCPRKSGLNRLPIERRKKKVGEAWIRQIDSFIYLFDANYLDANKSPNTSNGFPSEGSISGKVTVHTVVNR